MKRKMFFVAMLILFGLSINGNAQGVSINASGNPPDSSAMLDVNSIIKGILIPRMNSSQRIAIPIPATSLLVYDTDFDEFWYFDGVQWVSISGSQGPTGPTGTQGIQGLTGSIGLQGSTGPTGAQGSTGLTGVQGSTGSQGVQGIAGPTGVDGLTGPIGPTGIGSIGPTGQQGIPGSTGVDGATGAMGPIGLQGIPGVTGTDGINGITGPTGPQGNQGVQGTQGIQGITGPAGSGSGWIKPKVFNNAINGNGEKTYATDIESYFSVYGTFCRLEIPGQNSQERNMTVDLATIDYIDAAVCLNGYLYILARHTTPNGYQVYRYDITNISAGGTLMTIAGVSLYGVPGDFKMTADLVSGDFYFNKQAGNSVNYNIVSKYTLSGTTLTWDSDITCGATTNDVMTLCVINGDIYGTTNVTVKIKKFDNTGTLLLTSPIVLASATCLINFGEILYGVMYDEKVRIEFPGMINFGGGNTGPVGPQGPTGPTGSGGGITNFADINVFSGTAPISYTDLDLSSVIGATQRMVLLRVGHNQGTNRTFSFRTNGDTNDYYRTNSGDGYGLHLTNFNIVGNFATVLVKTDINGIVEWRWQGGIGTTTIDVLAWW